MFAVYSTAPMDGNHWYGPGLEHVWLPYAQMKTVRPPLPVARTHGCRIVLADGRELIDGIASWWTACHGYNHPHIREALERQLATMPHVMFGGLVHEQALTLARRLAALLPGDLDRVFFSDSGSVAVEIAMKMAVQYWRNRGEHSRSKFVAFRGGYHGDTTGAMAVSDPDAGMHEAFKGLLPEHVILDLPAASDAALSAFLQIHGEEIAGIIVEPLVQGAGGMKFHDAVVLQRLRALADRHGLLLIFDEIFTGFGRTGSDVCLRSGGCCAGHRHVVEGVDRRHAAARRHGGAQACVRCVLVGRSGASADARADLHGQRTWLRRCQRLARSVRARAAIGASEGNRRSDDAGACVMPRASRASRTFG